MKTEIFSKFSNFKHFSEFSLIDDKVRLFRIDMKKISNPVGELKSWKTIHVAGP